MKCAGTPCGRLMQNLEGDLAFLDKADAITFDIVAALQALQGMPESLVISIMRTCRHPLLMQLSMLPHAVHVAAIHAAFPSISAERSLHLSPTLLGDSRVTVLLPSIASITTLHTLVLKFTHLDAAAINAVVPAVGKFAAQSLRHVTLDFHAGTRGPRPPDPPHFVSKAHPRHKETGRHGAAALAKSLAHFTYLHTLNVECNAIGAQGVRLLAPALVNVATLHHLNLAHGELGPRGAIALGQHLSHLTALRHLNLAVNEIGVDGVAAVAPELALLTALQQLTLAGNDIKAEGASALGPHLAKLTSLDHLLSLIHI